jgi:hypothetical protein
MKAARQLSLAILLLLSAAALFFSYHMITDPTGSSLNLPFYLLNGTIISSYLVVGWVLLFTVGILSAIVVLLIMSKNRFYSFFIMLQGAILCVFVFVQWILIGETFIVQYIFLIMAVILIGLGALQNQRKIVVDTEKETHYHPEPKSHHHKHRKNK